MSKIIKSNRSPSLNRPWNFSLSPSLFAYQCMIRRLKLYDIVIKLIALNMTMKECKSFGLKQEKGNVRQVPWISNDFNERNFSSAVRTECLHVVTIFCTIKELHYIKILHKDYIKLAIRFRKWLFQIRVGTERFIRFNFIYWLNTYLLRKETSQT